MGKPAEAVDPEGHRRLGVDLFNETWTLLAKAPRSPEEDDELLHCAHASAYHWLHAGGTDANRARSQWQCSRAHSVLGQAEGAIYHAERCLAIVRGVPEVMEEFDLAAAYEALARAHAVAGSTAESLRWLELGRAAAAEIPDEDDRAIVEADLASVPISG